MTAISVIVPVYNVQMYLRHCIDSIMGQTFKSFELILIDDGSPDDCGKICDEYADKYDNVIVIHQTNQGLSEARNSGIDYVLKYSDSEWITFIDSDDWIHRCYLEILYNSAVRFETTMAICNCIKTYEMSIDDAEVTDDLRIFTPEEFWCFRQYGTACAKLYKREDFAEIRYPKGLLYEDAFITYRLIFMQKCIVWIECPLYYYYSRSGSITLSAWSPKDLSELDARNEQLNFFLKNKYNNIYMR